MHPPDRSPTPAVGLPATPSPHLRSHAHRSPTLSFGTASTVSLARPLSPSITVSLPTTTTTLCSCCRSLLATRDPTPPSSEPSAEPLPAALPSKTPDALPPTTVAATPPSDRWIPRLPRARESGIARIGRRIRLGLRNRFSDRRVNAVAKSGEGSGETRQEEETGGGSPYEVRFVKVADVHWTER